MAKYSRRDFMKTSAAMGTAALAAPQAVEKVPARAEKVLPKKETITIWIKDDKLKYDKMRVELYPGDTVEWVSSDRLPFTIHFPGVTPLRDASFRTEAGGTPSVSAVVPVECPVYGCFKYFVALFDKKKVLTDDPDIIVNPKPGGRGGKP